MKAFGGADTVFTVHSCGAELCSKLSVSEKNACMRAFFAVRILTTEMLLLYKTIHFKGFAAKWAGVLKIKTCCEMPPPHKKQ